MDRPLVLAQLQNSAKDHLQTHGLSYPQSLTHIKAVYLQSVLPTSDTSQKNDLQTTVIFTPRWNPL